MLDLLVRDEIIEQCFTGIRENNEEVDHVRYSFYKLMREFGLTFEQRDCVGYYITDILNRTIAGLHPMTNIEFIWSAMYASCVVYKNPDLSLSIDFVTRLSQFYEIDAKAVDYVVKCLKKQ